MECSNFLKTEIGVLIQYFQNGLKSFVDMCIVTWRCKEKLYTFKVRTLKCEDLTLICQRWMEI